jgi:LacI family transcriptional regulator
LNITVNVHGGERTAYCEVMASSAPAVTIIDVARVAGVSRQTVTRALNGLPDISEATRARVVDAARALNYRPNRAAQGLVRGRDVAIGLVVEDFRNPYYPELASALSRIAAERAWSVILCDTGDDEVQSKARIAALLRRVDALVLTGCRDGTIGMVPIDDLRGGILGIPTVMLGGAPQAAVDAQVEIDHRAGVTAAMDHLTATGRTRIAMIDSAQLPGSSRQEAFRAYLSENGLNWTPESELQADETHHGGIQAASTLLERYPDADAVLVYNDVMAIGALKGFARAGIRVPEQIAVVGTDGLDVGALVTPELTTLSIDKPQLARYALELVELMLTGGQDLRAHSRQVGLTLVVRESA